MLSFQFFMNIDTGMVRMVLANYTREGQLTDDFFMIPFPVLTFDAFEFAYRLTVSESTLSKVQHVTDPVGSYYPLEQMKKVYSKFRIPYLRED